MLLKTSIASCLLPNLQIVSIVYTVQWRNQTLSSGEEVGSFFSFLLALQTFIPTVVFYFLFKLAGNWVRVRALPKIHHCYTLHVAVAFSDAEISERIDFTRVGGGLLILNYLHGYIYIMNTSILKSIVQCK